MCYNNAVAKNRIAADIAQEVECVLGKDEVTGSNPVISSMDKGIPFGMPFSINLCQR